MKIKLPLVSILLLMGINIFAQEYIIRVKTLGSEYYFVDENGKALSDKKYKYALDFSEEGVTIVSDKRESGYKIINTKEGVIETNFPLKPIFNDWIVAHFGFKNGMLRTQFNEKMGAFNTKGILTIPVLYDHLTNFYSNHAIGVIGEKHMVVKNNGDQIDLDIKNIKSYKRFSEGLAPIRVGKNWGFVDTLGQMAITPRFKSVGYFYGGLAWAKTFGLKVGFIDKVGNWVIQPKFSAAQNYDSISGLARVKSNESWGYVNINNEFESLGVKGPSYDFSEGLAITKSEGSFGYMNPTGECVLKAVFIKAYPFKNGFAKVGINTKLGVIDKEGKWLISPKYYEIGHVIKIKHETKQ